MNNPTITIDLKLDEIKLLSEILAEQDSLHNNEILRGLNEFFKELVDNEP